MAMFSLWSVGTRTGLSLRVLGVYLGLLLSRRGFRLVFGFFVMYLSLVVRCLVPLWRDGGCASSDSFRSGNVFRILVFKDSVQHGIVGGRSLRLGSRKAFRLLLVVPTGPCLRFVRHNSARYK